MRRSIWCTGVVMIGGAAWLYLAATYVCTIPTPVSAVLPSSPTAWVANSTRFTGSAMPSPFASAPAWTSDAGSRLHPVETRKAAPACEPCIPSIEAIAASVRSADRVALSCASRYTLEAECVEGKPCDVSEECTSGVITVGAFAPPAGDEDTDPAPKAMPPLPPDNKSDEAPATMPYEEDENDPEGAALLDFWKSLFEEKTDKKEGETSDEPKTMKPEEESEPPQEHRRIAHCSNGNCQMPASHYSSHPSCPGMVTCPYTGRTYPANPDDDAKEPVVPTPTLKKKKKKKTTPATCPARCQADPDGKATESRFTGSGRWNTAAPDSKKGEFDPQPE